jgi:Mrp family chromosome partitioning ATPase
MQQLLQELRHAFDVVLVDCAPLLPVTDPMVVARFADGVLLIARAAATTRDQAQAARNACAKAGVTVFGTAMNATKLAEGDQSAYYVYDIDRRRQPTDPDPGLGLVVDNGGNPNHLAGGRAARFRTRSGAR